MNGAMKIRTRMRKPEVVDAYYRVQYSLKGENEWRNENSNHYGWSDACIYVMERSAESNGYEYRIVKYVLTEELVK